MLITPNNRWDETSPRFEGYTREEQVPDRIHPPVYGNPLAGSPINVIGADMMTGIEENIRMIKWMWY